MGHAHEAGRCKAELYVSLTCALRIVQIGVESDLRQVPLHGALGVSRGALLLYVKLNPSAEDFARFNCDGIRDRARLPASSVVSGPS